MSSGGRKCPAGEIQVCERQQREHLGSVLGDATIAHLPVAELALHDTKHMLDFRAHLADPMIARTLAGRQPAAGAAVAGRGESQAEEAVGGVDAGPGSTEGASDKKMVRPAAKREAVVYLRNVLRMSERRACLLIAADRKMVRYRSRRPSDVELRTRLRDLANQRRRFGYRRLFILLREQGDRRASTGSIDSTARKG